MGNRITEGCEVIRLTNDPKHHVFGFHDLIITNKKCDKYLSLEIDVMNRPQLPGEKIGVGYVQDGEYVRVGETEAMNYPQGSRQQWIADTDCFVVNNRVGDVWGCDLYDTTDNHLIDRFESTAHMVSKDGTKAYGLDYARLHRLGVYGYIGLQDKYADDPAPAKSGIWVLDLKTKEKRLLVSVREVAEQGKCQILPNAHHYITHLCLNPSSTRIAFLHRYPLPDGGGMSRLMTIGVDGSNLRCIAQGFLSHYHWKDDSTIYIYGRANSAIDSLRNNRLLSSPLLKKPVVMLKKTVRFFMGSNRSGAIGKSFIQITDSDTPTITPFAQDLMTVDGHPMTNPKFRDWCSNDTYPDEEGVRELMLYSFSQNLRIDLGTFKRVMGPPDMKLKEQFFTDVDSQIIAKAGEETFALSRTGYNSDLHPRWNADGTVLVFDSIHEGTRQLYAVNVEEIIKKYSK